MCEKKNPLEQALTHTHTWTVGQNGLYPQDNAFRDIHVPSRSLVFRFETEDFLPGAVHQTTVLCSHWQGHRARGLLDGAPWRNKGAFGAVDDPCGTFPGG